MTDSVGLELLEQGRRGRSDTLAQHARHARATAGWSASSALQLALAWLLAGDPRQADLSLLEAHQLDPSLALVPDVWGLWPAPAPPVATDPDRDQALALAQHFRAWRHPDAQALWSQLLPQLQANWRAALEPPLGDTLLILGRASAEPGAAPLDPPLEPQLAPLVAEAEIAAEPAAASRFWQLIATIRPQWDLARIRAADLALARGELEASVRWLADPPSEALTNPWFHDVAARQAVVRGDLIAALEAWAEAIRLVGADVSSAALEEIFEQRRREARRGLGVLQVRSLAKRGEHSAALALLERLLAEDPHWQPLRNLRKQIQPSPPAPAGWPGGDAGIASLRGFDALLERATATLQARGLAPQVSLRLPASTASAATDPEAMAAELAAIERRLGDYEARFALA